MDKDKATLELIELYEEKLRILNKRADIGSNPVILAVCAYFGYTHKKELFAMSDTFSKLARFICYYILIHDFDLTLREVQELTLNTNLSRASKRADYYYENEIRFRVMVEDIRGKLNA